MFVAKRSEDIRFTTKSGNRIYWLVSQEAGAPNFELRYIEIPPGGRTSYGRHAHEHEVFVITGEGELIGDGVSKRLEPGIAVFVGGNELHQFANLGSLPFGFICVVPKGAESESKPSPESLRASAVPV